METTKIVVTRRSADYHACIKGHPEIWGCGASIAEAVGNLVQTHRTEFNLEFEADMPDPV